MPYSSQSQSLKFVQKYGNWLESAVREILGWPKGRVVYHRSNTDRAYDIELDAFWPSKQEPRAFVSVTYTRPDKPGHSNENKLHLKLGELILLKSAYPQIRSVLVIGGNRESWLQYVLTVFNRFFDRTIFAWEPGFEDAIKAVTTKPEYIQPRYETLWDQIRGEHESIALSSAEPIRSTLRRGLWELVKELGCEGQLPSDISNRIFRHCMQRAFDRHKGSGGQVGAEWTHYQNEKWNRLWQSRSFFNPSEAAIELTLSDSGFAFQGGLARDVEIPSLLHKIAPDEEVERTRLSEDFVLWSRARNQPVFIQAKSSGGGATGHGKNIQNRTKEQLARALLYRATLNNGIELRAKDFTWIGILDNNWGVTRRTPLKYIHMLQWAGYDDLLAADALVDPNYNVLPPNENPLSQLLRELDCEENPEELKLRWNEWKAARA